VHPDNTGTTLQSTPGKPSSGHRRSRRSRSSYRCEAKIRHYKYLLAGISIFFLLVYVFTWFHMARKSTEHQQTMLEFRKQEVALKAVTSELDTIRSEMAVLVQNRIPGLLPIKFDEVITVDASHIRNIIFTLVKNGKKRNYEYHLVMQNDTLSIIHPVVEILLFDETGIQIGVTQVETRHASTATRRSTLDPGEVRSYTSSLNLNRGKEPSYFLLAVSESKQIATDRLREHLGNVLSP
jgi:hypothetical protein